MITTITVYWQGWRPLVLKSDRESGMTVSFLRGTFNLEKLLFAAINLKNKIYQNSSLKRYSVVVCRGTLDKVNSKNGDESKASSGGPPATQPEPYFDYATSSYNSIGYSPEDFGEPFDNAMERLVFTSQQEAAIEEAKTWLNSQIWFKQRGIPWKRGWLLKGSAGTGKTSMVKAVGQLLDLPVVFFDLASMTNYDCQMAWQRAEGLTPCIVLLEDVDAVFNGRENTISIKYGVFGVTFDCLLNCIDGVINSDGIFLMVTTNYPEKLDTALSGITGNGITTRPGRIDRVIEFGYIGREGKLKIAQRIFAGFPEEVYRELIDDQLLTGAQFQEKCTRLALKLFWKK
jgi:hypothetical protein